MKYEEFCFTAEDIVSQNEFVSLAEDNSGNLLFIKTDVLVKKEPIFWNDKHHPPGPWPPLQKVWITGHSDYPMESSTLLGFEGQYSNLFSANVDIQKEGITPIPLGIQTHVGKGIIDLLLNCRLKPKGEGHLIFKSFRLATYPGERCVIDHLFENQPWVYSKYPLSMEEYYTAIRNSKFVFCPRGNGFDTHRLWEVLYLGAIPVVRSSYLMNYFAKYLPICLIHSWDQITPELLEYEYERIMKTDTWDPSILKMPYWREKILATSKACGLD